MRTETNDALVRRNKQIAQYLFFASFIILIAGLFVTNSQVMTTDDPVTGIVLPSLVLPAAFVLTIASVRMTNLWVRQPRPEIIIRENLKGLSNRSVLYNYYFFPARHVLIAPQGVFAIVTRYQNGQFAVEGERWRSPGGVLRQVTRIFRFDYIGNPTLDAYAAAERVRKMLQPIAPDVPVQPLVVFVDPRADLIIGETPVPVLFADKRDPSLRDYLRDVAKEKRPSLTPEQVAAFEAAAGIR